MRLNGGYTAIEMMVVMTLVGLTSTIALVNHTKQLPQQNLRLASRQIISHLRQLRQKAITRNTRTSADFHVNGDPLPDNRYALWDAGEKQLPAHIRFGYSPEVNQTPKSGPLSASSEDGISLNGNQVAFEPNGTASGLGGYIYLTNAPLSFPDTQPPGPQYQTVAISVNITGHVKLYQWKNRRWE